MSPEESRLLYYLGNSLLNNLTSTITGTLLYGVFLSLFSISIITFLRRGLSNRPAWIMFIVTVVSFAIATINFAISIVNFTMLIRTPLVNNPDMPLDLKRDQTNTQLFMPGTIALWCSTVPPILCDMIAIWRAFVLFPERRWVMMGPVFLLLGTIATTFAYLVLTLKLSGGSAASSGHEYLLDNMFSASIAVSLATNATATLLIAFVLWTHRKLVINYRDSNRRRSDVQKILFLLVESGIIYCALQLVFLVLFLVPPDTAGPATWTAMQVFNAAYPMLSLIYPIAVVVLVNNRRSFVEAYGFSSMSKNKRDCGHSNGSRPATAGHLSFAPPPNHSTIDTGSSPDVYIPEHFNSTSVAH